MTNAFSSLGVGLASASHRGEETSAVLTGRSAVAHRKRRSDLAEQELAVAAGVSDAMRTAFSTVFTHVVQTVLRNDGVLILPGCVLGGTPELLQRIVAWDSECSDTDDSLDEREGDNVYALLDLHDDDPLVFTLVDLYGAVSTYLTLTGFDFDDSLEPLMLAATREFTETVHSGKLIFERVDLEETIENWLVENLHILGDELDRPELGLFTTGNGRSGRQYRFTTGRRADLICRERDHGRSGQYIVAELKAGYAGAADVEQLSYYLELTAAELDTTNAGVRGVLIADGFSPNARGAAREHSIALSSLVSLGYHDARLLHALGRDDVTPSRSMLNMAMRVGQAGLPMPLVPPALIPHVQRRRSWFWSTADIDQLSLYWLAGGEDPANDLVGSLPDGDWFAFGTLGHGLQSNFIVYASSLEGVVCAGRTPWGNAYSDPDKERADAADWLATINAGGTPLRW